MLSEVVASPTAAMVQEAMDEVVRVNEVYWRILHFDKWSPFCNQAVGKYYPAVGGEPVSCAVTMHNVEQEWAANQIADHQVVLQNTMGNRDYADMLYISASVGFRSAELPEPYTGTWSLEFAAMQQAPLIVCSPNAPSPLDVQIEWQAFSSLQK